VERRIAKLERKKNGETREVHEELKRSEIPFWRKLVAIIGWIRAQLHRRIQQPYNILTWESPGGGINESNHLIDNDHWYGIKLQTENLRGELGREEVNPNATKDVNVFVFNAGNSGCYRVSAYVELIYGDQLAADEYGLDHLRLKLTRNWAPFKRDLAKTRMITPGGVYYLSGAAYGGDIVKLNAGDKLSVWANISGWESPSPYNFTIKAHMAINYIGGEDVKQINNEEGTWN